MNTDNQNDALDQRIEAALARLPDWQAPPDFTARLAAAAARAVPAAVVKPEPFWEVALDHLIKVLPTVLLSAGLAAMLVWTVPWERLSTGSELVWACVAAMGTAGLVLTRRLLQAP